METVNSRLCKECGSKIPEGRIKAVPGTQTCVEHSTAERFAAAVISLGNPEDDAFQEIEILRSSAEKKAYQSYKDSLGNYNKQ